MVSVCVNIPFLYFVNFPADSTQYYHDKVVDMTSKKLSLFWQIDSYYSHLASSNVFEPRDNNSSTF